MPDGIVVCFKHLMNQVDHRGFDFSVSSAIMILGKQAKEAVAIDRFSFTIPLLPAASGPRWNGGSCLRRSRLFLVVILFRMDDPIAEHCNGRTSLAGLFKQGLTDLGETRGGFWWAGRQLMVVENRVGSCGFMAKNR